MLVGEFLQPRPVPSRCDVEAFVCLQCSSLASVDTIDGTNTGQRDVLHRVFSSLIP